MGSGRVVVLKYSIRYFQVPIYSMVFPVILGIIPVLEVGSLIPKNTQSCLGMLDISGYQNIGSTRNIR